MAKISAVINTINEAKKIGRCLASLKGFASEIIVVDMHSSDATVEIAKKYGAKVFKHKKLTFVEPARNFGIDKAKNDWILILDPDEELSDDLKTYLKKEAKEPQASFYRIPRKNIIFGKWMKYSGWWPDLNIRFFKRGSVTWNEVIHSIPMTVGKGLDLPEKEELAIKHRNYSSVEEYISKMNRYSTVQARELNKKGVEFKWRMLIVKPASEFLRRYFAEQGYKDGLHGLAIGLLQILSELVIYIKLWQRQDFRKRKVDSGELFVEFSKVSKEYKWWMITSRINDTNNFISKLWLKIQRKFL